MQFDIKPSSHEFNEKNGSIHLFSVKGFNETLDEILVNQLGG